MRVKNISEGPRGVWSDNTVVMLMPGQTMDDLNVTAADLAVAKKTGWFEFNGSAAEPEDDDPAPPADAELDKLNDDELIAYITERGGKADKRMSRNTLLTAAEKVKG